MNGLAIHPVGAAQAVRPLSPPSTGVVSWLGASLGRERTPQWPGGSEQTTQRTGVANLLLQREPSAWMFVESTTRGRGKYQDASGYYGSPVSRHRVPAEPSRARSLMHARRPGETSRSHERVEAALDGMGYQSPTPTGHVAQGQVLSRVERPPDATWNMLGDESIGHSIEILLMETPVESGMSHPLDDYLVTLVQNATSSTWSHISRVASRLLHDKPRLGADLIACLGRLESRVVCPWGHTLAGGALLHPGVAVRDAAVRALEQWGDRVALRILQSTNEPVPWLREYIREVLAVLD